MTGQLTLQRWLRPAAKVLLGCAPERPRCRRRRQGDLVEIGAQDQRVKPLGINLVHNRRRDAQAAASSRLDVIDTGLDEETAARVTGEGLTAAATATAGTSGRVRKRMRS